MATLELLHYCDFQCLRSLEWCRTSLINSTIVRRVWAEGR